MNASNKLKYKILRRLNTKTFFLFPLVIVLAGLNACTSGESNVETGNHDGIFHMGFGFGARSLDPQVATDSSSANIMWAIHEGLVISDVYTLESKPGVAESWEISDDGKVYTFKIRDNAKWSDGSPLTAEHVYWSFKRHLTPELGNPWSFMLFPVINAEAYVRGDIDNFEQVGFKLLDGNRFEIELSNPTPYFLQLLAHASSAIVSKEAIEAHGEITSRFSLWTRAGNLISNGPFYLSRWDINQPIEVKRNPNYWGHDEVSLNEIHFHSVEVTSTEERMFKAGQLHKTNILPDSKVAEYRENNPESLVLAPYLGTYFYSFNMKREPFDDPRVRKALSMTINREAIVETLMYGITTPSYAMVPPGTIGYQPPKTFEYNPDEARRLLAEAGYPNGEGFREFELIYNTNEAHRQIAVAIQQMWKEELNLDVTLANQEWKVYLDTQDNFDFDVSRAGWIGDYVDPMTFLDLGTSANGSNTAAFYDDHYDDLIFNYVPAATTPEERLARFYEAETYLMEQMPFAPIYTYATRYLLHPSVKGLPANLRQYIDYREITLEPINNSAEDL